MRESKARAWVVVAFFALFMAVMSINLIVYPACAIDTMAILGVSQVELTTLTSVASCVGMFAGIVFGPLTDRYGARRVLALSLAVGLVAFVVRIFAEGYIAALALTFVGAFCITSCQVSSSKVLDTWFPKDKISVIWSIQASFGGIGSVTAFAAGAAIGLIGCLWLIAGGTLVLLILWIAVGGYGPIAPEAQKAPKGAIRQVYTCRHIWMLALGYGAGVTVALILGSNMINSFVAKGLDPAGASLMGALVSLGQFIGGFAGAMLMGILKRYNLCTWVLFGGAAVFIPLCWFVPLGPQTWVLAILGALFMGNLMGVCAGRTALVPLTGKLSPAAVGTAGGALEVIKGAVSFVIPIAVSAACGTDFNLVFAIFAVVCVLGAVCAGSLVPELGPKGALQGGGRNR